MRRLALALGAVALAACKGDDPYAGGFNGGSCLSGSWRAPGPACTIATQDAFYLDGRGDEWQTEELSYEHPASCCELGDAGGIHAGRASDGTMLLFVDTVGPPADDGRFYLVALWQHRFWGEPEQELDLVLYRDHLEVLLNGLRVYGLPIEQAWGQDGVEVRIPADALPFPGAAYILGWTYSADGQPLRTPPFRSEMCWDPENPKDPCAIG